jgi:hypothetical protein
MTPSEWGRKVKPELNFNIPQPITDQRSVWTVVTRVPNVPISSCPMTNNVFLNCHAAELLHDAECTSSFFKRNTF